MDKKGYNFKVLMLGVFVAMFSVSLGAEAKPKYKDSEAYVMVKQEGQMMMQDKKGQMHKMMIEDGKMMIQDNSGKMYQLVERNGRMYEVIRGNNKQMQENMKAEANEMAKRKGKKKGKKMTKKGY